MPAAAFPRTAFLRSGVTNRAFHTSRVTRSAGHDHQLVPFSYKSKTTFALKIACFFAGSFAIPFATAAWQLSKNKAADV
jgi:hypothetical protein